MVLAEFVFPLLKSIYEERKRNRNSGRVEELEKTFRADVGALERNIRVNMLEIVRVRGDMAACMCLGGGDEEEMRFALGCLKENEALQIELGLN